MNDALLVPTVVEALVLPAGALRDQGILWADRTPDYGALMDPGHPEVHGGHLVPEPFSEHHAGSTLPAGDPGVHLHWALPAGLARGVSGESGITYPAAPNRWLVIRRAWPRDGGPGSTPFVRAWVVESDFLGDVAADPSQAGSAPWPEIDLADTSRTRVRYLGRTLPADGWTEVRRARRLPILTAIGPGDPLFAASYPRCRNVFGLWDRLDDVPAGPCRLSYGVVGWYATAGGDPLADETAAELYAALGGPALADGARRPKRTVVHASLVGVPWGDVGSPRVPDVAPAVGVGNSSAEAVAALLAAAGRAEPDDGLAYLWEAIQLRLTETLGEQDGAIVVEQEGHAHAFEAIPGGSVWAVRPSRPSDAEASLPSLPSALAAPLNSLDRQQAALDRLEDELVDLRRAADALWVAASERLPGGGPSLGAAFGERVEAFLLGPVRDRIDGHVELVGQARAARDTLCQAVEAALGALGAWPDGSPFYTIERRPAARYWRPADPVVALSLPQRRVHKHGIELGATETAYSRLSSEIVSGIQLGGELRFEAAQLPEAWLAALPTRIVAEARALQLEGLLLDPDAAASLWGSAVRLEDALAQAQSLAPSGARLPAAMVRPSVEAGGAWQPPWNPLVVEWEGTWRRSWENTTLGNIAGPDTPWRLGGVDYRWSGGGGDGLDAHRSTLAGSALVSGRSGSVLGERLRDFLEGIPEGTAGREELAAQVESLGRAHLLTCSFGGLHDQLLLRRLGLRLPVLHPDRLPGRTAPSGAAAVESAVRRLVGDETRFTVDDDLPFEPFRAGHLELERLWILDAFGRVQPLGLQAEPVARAPSVRPPETAGALTHEIQLPPRFCQPARLQLRWCDARLPRQLHPSTAVPDTSPIAGWLLPDVVASGVHVYDRAGRLALTLRLGEGEVEVEAPPGHDAPAGPIELRNPHLGQIVGWVLDLKQAPEEQRARLQALLALMDRALAGIDPPGGPKDPYAALIAGRPVAVVRASVRLELQGLPAADLRVAAMLPPLGASGPHELSIGGVLGQTIEVRIGDPRRLGDGVIAYFAGEDSRTLQVARSRPADAVSAAIAFDATLSLHAGEEGPTALTLLLDPRGQVHAASGVLPTKTIALPREMVDPVVRGLEPVFPLGPALSEAHTPRLPLPTDGHWTWIHRGPDGAWEEDQEAAPEDDRAHFRTGRIHAVEGWLRWHRHAPPQPGDPAVEGDAIGAGTIEEAAEEARAVGETGLRWTFPVGGAAGAKAPKVAARAPLPFALSFDRGAVSTDVPAHPEGLPLRLSVAALPRYPEPRRQRRIDDDCLYAWFLWERDGEGGTLLHEEQSSLRTLTGLSLAAGVVIEPTPDFAPADRGGWTDQDSWTVEAIHGVAAGGTGHCWMLRPASGRLVGEGASAGAVFTVNLHDVPVLHAGRALLVVQGWIDGRHTDLGSVWVEKRPAPPVILDFQAVAEADWVRVSWSCLRADRVRLDPLALPIERDPAAPEPWAGSVWLAGNEAGDRLDGKAPFRLTAERGHAEAGDLQRVEAAARLSETPPGTILLWSGRASALPIGWVLCDGNNGAPDLRDRFVVGAAGAYVPGATGGLSEVVLTTKEMPKHAHQGVTAGTYLSLNYQGVVRGTSGMSHGILVTQDGDNENQLTTKGKAPIAIVPEVHAHGIPAEGGGAAHENRPPYFALCYIFKLGLPQVEAGEYRAEHPFWAGVVTLRHDGTFARDTGDGGRWSYTAPVLELAWTYWAPERLENRGGGTFVAPSNGFRLWREAPP